MLRRLLATLVLLVVVQAPAFAQGQRIALVIGVGAYRNVPALANPPRDARSIADGLRRAGFRTELVIDPDRAALERAIRTLGAAASTADVVMFFYAGHALEFNGQNYLVPVSAAIQSGRDLPFETVNLDLVASQVEKARTTFIFLDACRDNPFSLRLGGGERGVAGRGLAPPGAASTGTLVAFATAPGRTAADGAGDHSPFTRALLAAIDVPGLEIRQLLGRVRRQVREETNGQQVPWESSALEGEFYFHPGAAPVPGPAVAALPAPASRPVEAPAATRTPAPMQQALIAPAPIAPARPPATGQPGKTSLCPGVGTEVVLSTGARVVYGGSDASDPALCVSGDGRTRLLYGIVGNFGSIRAQTAAAIKTLLAAAPGTKVEFDDIQQNGFWHCEWTYMMDDTVVIGGEPRRAAHLVYHRVGRVGNRYEGRTHYWLDRVDGMLLQRKYEYISGDRSPNPDFIVVSIRRPG